MRPLRSKKLTEREEEIKAEYLKTLEDLTSNSKPLIDVLTEVAAENKDHAACTVECIEEQLNKVSGPLKLPILYLVDSIIKCNSIKQYYLPMFHRKIHTLFMKVFQACDESIRPKLSKLRFTWNGVLPQETLTTLDRVVRSVDPTWQAPPAVRVDPKFLMAGVTAANVVASSEPTPPPKKLPKTSESVAVVNGRRETATALTPRIVIARKCGKRNESPEKPTVAAPVAPKKTGPSSKPIVAANEPSSAASAPATEDLPPPVKKRKIEKSTEEKSPPRSSNGAKKDESRNKRKTPYWKRDGRPKSEYSSSRRKATTTVDDLFEDPPKKREKQAVKSFSREEPLKSLLPPPKPESTEEYDPIADLPEPEMSHSMEAEPKVEQAASTPPTQDVDVRSLMAPASVILPPAVSTSKSPLTAPLLPVLPFLVPGMEFGFPGMVTPPILVPNASADVLDVIDRDPLSTISIDGVPREIRHYACTVVVFLNWDDPRQILFSSDDSPRRIVVDDKYNIACRLNAPYVKRKVYGKRHGFRLGAPTRELYVDGTGYQCVFGGSPNENVRLGERCCSVRLEGKPPKVDIGPKRQDLVGGKVSLYINDKHTFQLFLDSKAQKIEVEGCKFVFTFIDSLQKVLINDVPFRADFGGINYPFMHLSKLFFFRLSILPLGIIPGAVQIYEMKTSESPEQPPRYTAGEEFPLLPAPPVMSNVPMMPVALLPAPIIMSPAEPSTTTTLAATEPNTLSAVKTEESTADSSSIDELVQKLLAKGLISRPEVTSTTSVGKQSSSNKLSSSRSRKSRKRANHPPKVEPVKYVDLENPDTFRQKQPGMVSLLYTGTQCGSCGLRFPKEQTLKYSEHLDWHFRLNRRGKDGARTIHSRKWYYKKASWLQFQEMEDESDRGTSWFDNHPATEYTEEVIEEVPCVGASADLPEQCELCEDRFEQFYHQDLEEWQMRNAVLKDNKVYHPSCLEGHKEEDDDVEEIVDTTEPISLTEDEPSVTEDDADVISVGGVASSDICLPVISSIKREKEDESAATPASANQPTEKTEEVEPSREADGQASGTNNDDDDGDSDIEEVQIIEEPIEEIIIPDDENDLEDSHLETLYVEGVITAPEFEGHTDTIPEPVVDDPADRIVDITQNGGVISIDGNVEPGNSMPPMVLKPTVIKFNIAREKSKSPAEAARSSPKNGEVVKTKRVEDCGRTTRENEEPPLPEEETTTVTLMAPASVKPRIRERKLTEYPPVQKGSDDSGLCSIM